MSVTYGFYNSKNSDRKYDAIQMSSILDGIVKDGILRPCGNNFKVTADGKSMTIKVGTGRAWFNHTWTLNDSTLPLTVSEADAVLGRIDAVILDIDTRETVRANSIKIIKGNPASKPAKPTMTKSEGRWQYPLAYIKVNTGAKSIANANITNCVGTYECPYAVILSDHNVTDPHSYEDDKGSMLIDFEDKTITIGTKYKDGVKEETRISDNGIVRGDWSTLQPTNTGNSLTNNLNKVMNLAIKLEQFSGIELTSYKDSKSSFAQVAAYGKWSMLALVANHIYVQGYVMQSTGFSTDFITLKKGVSKTTSYDQMTIEAPAARFTGSLVQIKGGVKFKFKSDADVGHMAIAQLKTKNVAPTMDNALKNKIDCLLPPHSSEYRIVPAKILKDPVTYGLAQIGVATNGEVRVYWVLDIGVSPLSRIKPDGSTSVAIFLNMEYPIDLYDYN